MISVYVMDISKLHESGCYERAYALSDSRRQRKADALKFTADKCRCIGAGLLLSYVLRKRNIRIKEMEIKYNEAGKPYFAGEGVPFYNISHSENMVACVVGDAEVGIDIQKVVPFKPKAAERFFHKEEAKMLERLENEQEKALKFTELFAAKESYAKYIGTGVALVLNQKVEEVKDIKLSCKHIQTENGEYILAVTTRRKQNR